MKAGLRVTRAALTTVGVTRTDGATLAERDVGTGAANRRTGLLVTAVSHVIKVVVHLHSGGGDGRLRSV